MIKKVFIFILVLIFSCNTALAETWKTLNAGNKTIEIETSSIMLDVNNFGQDLYLYWVRTKKQDGIYKMLLASNCAHKKCVILKTMKFSPSGKMLSQKQNNPPVLQAISSGSGAEAAFKYICMLDVDKFKSYDSPTIIAQKALDESNFEVARINAINAYNAAVSLSNEGYSRMHIADALDLISRAYSGLGNNAEALRALNEAIAIAQNYTDTEFTQDLITRRDMIQNAVTIETQPMQDKQDRQVQSQQNKDALIYSGMQIIKNFTGY